MLKRYLILAFLCLLLVPLTLNAQSNDWRLVLLNPNGQDDTPELLVLTQGASQTITLPSALINDETQRFGRVAVSPDQRYLAASIYDASGAGQAPYIAIVDLTTGNCCTFATPPDTTSLQAFEVGSFNPEGTQFSAAFVSGDFTSNSPFEGGIVTIDAATGTVTSQVSMAQARTVTIYNDDFAVFALLGDWRADGIRYVPTCFACEGVIESPYYLWDPATGALSEAFGEYYSIFGDTLGVTGELLYTSFNPGFPQGENMGMFMPANTVEYYAEGRPFEEDVRATEAPIVYFDQNQLDLAPAHWVIDGQAFLVSDHFNSPGQETVVFRDLAQQSINIAADGQFFLAGTPDGWLVSISTYDNDAPVHNVTRFTWSNGQIVATSILSTQSQSPVQVVYEAPLGASVTNPFATITPSVRPSVVQADAQIVVPTPIPTSASIQPADQTCPGFLPSRLSVGGIGAVTPGAPNNMRQQPDTSSSVVGQIPGGGVFSVLAGPSCDPRGIAWWQVNYNGVVGWTAEGQGNTYYTEPR